jgi:hypothetical protein
MKVSITLPSLFPTLLGKCLTHIRATVTGIDYEVVVVSPFEVEGPDIVWVREDRPAGNCAAHRLAYVHSSGDVIVTLSDDRLPRAGWLTAVLHDLVRRERERPGTCLGLAHEPNILGTVFGIYYPFFPVAFRHTIERAGGYFSADFAAHFGDADLGLRIWRAGGRCLPCFDAKLDYVGLRDDVLESAHRQEKFLADMALFVDKWKDSYGRRWSSGHPRDFNLNIYEQVFDAVLKDGTIFHNDPEFGRRIRAYYEDYKVDYRGYP